MSVYLKYLRLKVKETLINVSIILNMRHQRMTFPINGMTRVDDMCEVILLGVTILTDVTSDDK